MPRRRENHCEVSAISGPNVAEAPNPISSVHEGEQCEVGGKARGDVSDAERHVPQTIGAMMPNRSDSRPSTTPPNANPTIAEREGKGRVAARGRELGLHDRQRHRHRPHADAADGAEQQGGASRNQA